MDETGKRLVEGLLRRRDFDTLVEMCEKDRRNWQEIRFHLYDLDEQLRWASIEAAAQLMKHWWKLGKEEKVRIYIRTLFWSISDESGGIGWSSPQTIAEIIVNIPELIGPYGSMMIAHCIEEPPLMKGCLWGIGRLGRQVTDSVYFFEDKVLETFHADDIETLGLASWAMGETGFRPAIPFLEELRLLTDIVVIYIKGDFLRKSLGEWAEEAVVKIEKMF